MSEHPNGTYAEFVKKQQQAEEDVEEGDANEDDAEPVEVKPDASKSGGRRGSLLKSKKSLRRDPKEEAMFEQVDARDDILQK